MKHIVSVSLGSSKRDKATETTLLGERFRIERIGTDGDLKRFQQMFAELDGKVDALGVGGADLHVWVENHRYTFRSIQRLISVAKKTPVVDGSGLKNTLEREAVETLQREQILDFSQSRVLMVAAVDRFGMAQSLSQCARSVVYGDLIFALGLPLTVRSYAGVRRLGKLILPIVTQLPFQWFYPTGEKQETRSPRAEKLFHEADIIAGDWHIIRKYMPDPLPHKTVLTNTLRKADIDFLAQAQVARVITTTPQFEGETFATNVMEGVIVALQNKRPEALTPQDYLNTLHALNWRPNVIELGARV